MVRKGGDEGPKNPSPTAYFETDRGQDFWTWRAPQALWLHREWQ